MAKVYSGIYKGFQIRDCNFIGKPPEDAKYKFDIVKWEDHDPYTVTDWETGEKKSSSRSCYSVATLIYNPREPDFELHSVGLRWLEEHPDEDVEDWILKWCEYKVHELFTND